MSNHTRDKHGLCVYENIPEVPEVYVHEVPSFDFGKALGEKYPLLRLVFNYLSYEELKNCARVNELWNMYAVESMNARTVKTLGWFFFRALDNKKQQLESNAYRDMSCGLIFCKKSFRLTKCICLHKGEDFKKLDALEVISKRFVGEDVPFILCYCTSVSYTRISPNISNPVMMNGFFIPKIPNAVVERLSGMEDQIMETFNEKIFQHNLEVRALIVFGVYTPDQPCCYINQILKKQKKLFALCGGIVAGCKSDLTFQEQMPNRRVVNKYDHGIAIAVPPESTNFEAYSATFAYLDDYESFLKQTQKSITFKNHTVALACRCVALIDDVGWIDLFAKYFPSIPITCVDVGGEFGWDKLEETECTVRNFIHQFTFVLIVLTWN